MDHFYRGSKGHLTWPPSPKREWGYYSGAATHNSLILDQIIIRHRNSRPSLTWLRHQTVNHSTKWETDENLQPEPTKNKLKQVTVTFKVKTLWSHM